MISSDRHSVYHTAVALGLAPDVLVRLRALLPAEHFVLVECHSIADALEALHAGHGDLVFLSLDGNGRHIAGELRAAWAHAVIIDTHNRSELWENGYSRLVDAHVPVLELPDVIAMQLIQLAFERKRLQIETKLYCEELDQLNRHLHHVIDEKTREIVAAKNRLTNLFQNVPALMAAVTIERKLEHAAAALTGPQLFAQATLFLEDRARGVVGGAADRTPLAADYAARYQTFKLLVMQSESDRAVMTPEEGPVETTTLLLGVRDHEGSLVGVAALADGDLVEVPHQETIALIQLFLTLTSQSVEQFRLEQDLEESEASYRSLIDNVGDVIFRLEPDGKLIFVSRQVVTLLGEHWRQVLGRSFFDLLDERNRTELRNVFPYLLEGHYHTRDLTFVRPDGKELIAFVSLNPITEHGAITGIMAVARDVTEKRRLEQQIEESEQRYRALTENAYDAIILVDPDSYRIVDANPQALKLVGFDRNELIGMSVFEIRKPDQAHQVVERISGVMATGSGRFEDVPIVRKDGSLVYVDTAASITELNGRRFYHAILRDMSVQRQMTAELNERLLELQILAEISDSLQSSVDLRSVMGLVLLGVTAGSGLGFNRAFILSYDRTHDRLRGETGVGPRSPEEAGRIWAEVEAKGLTLHEMIQQRLKPSPEDFENESAFGRLLQVDLFDPRNPFAIAVREREAVIVNLDEASAPIQNEFLEVYGARQFAIVPLVTQDDVLGVLLVDNRFSGSRIDQEDVARLKLFANSAASAMERGRLLESLERRLHELTRANQELKESRDRLLRTERLTAIGEVAASVAHEIRNPLAAIGGFARSVLSSLEDEDKNKSKLGIIVEETNRLDSILNAILEFSRPTAPRFAAVELNGLILQTVHFMDAEIDDTLIKVEFDLESQLPAVWADAGQIRQVFLNVLRNAVQEMPGGGVIRISSKIEGPNCRVLVSDTGSGIPEEMLARIFDAFYTTKPTGSGLGLSICSQIVRNHSGRMEASSAPGEGATFIITLPAAAQIP